MEYAFGLTDTAKRILEARYLQDGETKEELVTRVVDWVGQVDKGRIEDYRKIIESARFLPNSPCLVNAGRDVPNGLFACFVLGMEDNIESIIKTKGDALLITKAGGGWGVNLGDLRPKGSRVMGSTHGIAGGPVRFWRTLSVDADVMAQGGFRNAACMATMNIDHPDIMEFIHAKSPTNSVVMLLNLERTFGDKAKEVAEELLANSEAIRRSAETNLSNFNISVLATDEFMYAVSDSSPEGSKIVLSHPSGDSKEVVTSEELFHEIATNMWTNGEPGLLFIDRIRERTRYDPSTINATNPCGEQALPPNGSCCLGSINLAAHVKDGAIDNAMLGETIRIAVRFLNGMILTNRFPTKEIEEWSMRNRAIGLGVMGFAEMLIMMGIRYDSHMAVEVAEELAAMIMYESSAESKRMASENPNIESWDDRLNRALMSIAPTGTISLLAGTSPGIEPIFSDKIYRIDETGRHEVRSAMADEKSFVTVKDINPRAIIDIVAAWSKYVDNSVSYTVNVDNNATIEEIKELIIYAWERGCNGITIYRDGSRSLQVLNRKDEDKDSLRKRPRALSGVTTKHKASLENEMKSAYVTVNEYMGKPVEVFMHTPHLNNMKEVQLTTTATRLLSLALRHGAPPEDAIKQLRSIEGQKIGSIPIVLAEALAEAIGMDERCDECGGEIERSGGCYTCTLCGFSKCG